MTPKPPKSRARFFTVDDVEAAADRVQACVDEIKGLAHAMRADTYTGVMKIDGGDSIIDAVQLITAWKHKVEGVYRVQDVAAKMAFPHEPPKGYVEPAVDQQRRPKRRAQK